MSENYKSTRLSFESARVRKTFTHDFTHLLAEAEEETPRAQRGPPEPEAVAADDAPGRSAPRAPGGALSPAAVVDDGGSGAAPEADRIWGELEGRRSAPGAAGAGRSPAAASCVCPVVSLAYSGTLPEFCGSVSGRPTCGPPLEPPAAASSARDMITVKNTLSVFFLFLNSAE